MTIKNDPKAGIPIVSTEFDIVKYILDEGPLSRNDLTHLLGLSRSSITKAVANLTDQHLLVETEMGESSGGRRPGLLDVNAGFGYVIGLDMGATGANICIADFRGEILDTQRHRIQLRNNSPGSVMDDVFQKVHQLLDKNNVPSNRIYGIGIGVPAPVNQKSGVIVSPATMLGWDEFNIPAYCRREFPTAVVTVENDVNLMAIGESRIGQGRGHENFIFVKVGTGVGTAVVCGDAIYRGSTGVSGHIGHVSIDRNGPVCHCGNIGCLEKYTAGPAIAEQARSAVENGESPILARILAEKGQLSAEDVGTAAAEGDKAANNIIIKSGKAIGRVLATLVSFYNPSLVIIGGGVSNIGPQFVISIHRTVLEYSLPLSTQQITISKSDLGYKAGMTGAVALALENIFVTN